MTTSLKYPNQELVLKKQIDNLNRKWNEIINQEDTELGDLFVSDGFYPFYTKQSIKILFIGKESLDLAGDDYIETMYNAYKEGIIGCYALNDNRNFFHSFMLYVAWGILHDCPNFNDIPEDIEIVKDFAAEMGISFAFMNISKLSNNKRWEADKPLMTKFLNISKKVDLIAKEISKLKPHLIIGMLHAKNFRYMYLLCNRIKLYYLRLSLHSIFLYAFIIEL